MKTLKRTTQIKCVQTGEVINIPAGTVFPVTINGHEFDGMPAVRLERGVRYTYPSEGGCLKWELECKELKKLFVIEFDDSIKGNHTAFGSYTFFLNSANVVECFYEQSGRLLNSIYEQPHGKTAYWCIDNPVTVIERYAPEDKKGEYMDLLRSNGVI